LYNVIDGFTKVIKKSHHKIDTTKYNDFNAQLKDNLNKKTWDGEYYLRAFFDNGDKLGSSENTECKIDLISQSFSIISGVAPKDRAEQVLNSVEEKLVDHDMNIVKLLTPPFDKTLNNPGYIMNYSKGIRENGGQYTHAVAWYLMALIKMGYYDKAYEYFQMINPTSRTINQEQVNTYAVEPYVIAADIYSSLDFPARGGWTWYTGSAGWFYRVGVQDILGLHKQGDRLKISPSLPDKWNKIHLEYRYMDTIYQIDISRGSKEEVKLDGKGQSGDIRLVDDKKNHRITISVQ